MQEPVINESKQYSPYDYPPDLDIAKLHFENNQFGPPDPTLTEAERLARTDPYSNEGPKKLYDFNTKIEDMTSNGLETMLYFKSLKFIIIFIGLYAISQVYPYIRLVMLYHEVNCQKSCSYFKMFYEISAPMVFIVNSDNELVARPEYADIMTVGFVTFSILNGVIWIIFFYMRYDVEMSSLIFNMKRKPRVSDYTIMLGNVDQDTSDEALAEALTKHMQKHELGEPEILQITRGNYLNALANARREFLEAEKKIEEFNRGKELNYSRLDAEMKKQFDKVEAGLKKAYEKALARKDTLENKPKEKTGSTHRITSIAFITIKSAEKARLLLRYESYQTFCQHVLLYPRLALRFLYCGKKSIKFLPPPPTKNILWSHIGSCTFTRYFRYFMMAVCYLPFVLMFIIALGITTIIKTYVKADGNVGFITKIIFAYGIPFGLIKISHIVTDKVLLWLSGIGKGITVSNQRNILIMFNYFFRYTACVLALNIKLVLRRLRIKEKEVTDMDYLAFYSTQVFFYVLCDVGIGAAKKIVDLPLIITKLKIMWFDIQNKKEGGAHKTQRQVNEVFTKPKFELMDQYIEMMFLTYFVYSFNKDCPLATIIVFAYVVLKYWRDKANLVKNRRPADETEHIFSDYAWNVTFPLGILAASTIYFQVANRFVLNENPLLDLVLLLLRITYKILFLFNFFIQSWVIKKAHKNFDSRLQKEMVEQLEKGQGINPNISLGPEGLEQNLTQKDIN